MTARTYSTRRYAIVNAIVEKLKEINYKPINGLSDLCLKKNLN